MGVVYVAVHPLLNKKAVVKFLHAELSSNDEIIQRFFNEARSATMMGYFLAAAALSWSSPLDG